MSIAELTPAQKALQKSGLGFIDGARQGDLPADLQIVDGGLEWSAEGSSAKVPGRVKFRQQINGAQKTALTDAGIAEIKSQTP